MSHGATRRAIQGRDDCGLNQGHPTPATFSTLSQKDLLIGYTGGRERRKRGRKEGKIRRKRGRRRGKAKREGGRWTERWAGSTSETARRPGGGNGSSAFSARAVGGGGKWRCHYCDGMKGTEGDVPAQFWTSYSADMLTRHPGGLGSWI